MTLRDLKLLQAYRSDHGTILSTFYIPCLEEATRYDRAVGYFSSACLSAALRGLKSFVKRGGIIRLVASPVLSTADAEAIREGYRSREEILHDAVCREIDRGALDDVSRKSWELVAWLVSRGILDIRLAVVDRGKGLGVYHEKVGIFSDGDGEQVVFTGSSNESIGGLIANFESIDVFCSWIDGDRSRVGLRRDEFERLWVNDTAGLLVLGFPEAAQRALLRLCPPRDPLDDEPDFSDVVLEQRLIAHQVQRRSSWLLTELKPWQEAAVRKWSDNAGRGILAMATGSGKTITSLGAASRWEPLRFLLIAVPTTDLVRQWTEQIARRTELPPPVVLAGDASDWVETLSRKLRILNRDTYFRGGEPPVAIATFRSLSGTRFQQVVQDAGGFPRGTLLIGDEVHGMGAPGILSALDEDIDGRLGLSATPVRHFDLAGSAALGAYFGETVFEFPIHDAIAAGILCPYRYDVFCAQLDDAEYDEYLALTAEIARRGGGDLDDADEGIRMLLIQRAGILKAAGAKSALLDSILETHEFRRALVYCADIAQATDMAASLAARGLRVARFTTSDPDRAGLLRAYERDQLDGLVAVKCLDEGIDVPDARLALLFASDASTRQFIQRRGRVLRAADGKKRADVIDLLLTPPAKYANRGVFRSELHRVIAFAHDALNREIVISRLANELAPFGLTHGDFLLTS